MVKHNFWSVKGYFDKKIVKKKKGKKKRVKKKFCAKNLPNVLKNRVFGEKKTTNGKKKLIWSKTLIVYLRPMCA